MFGANGVRYSPDQQVVWVLANSYIHGLSMSFTSLVTLVKSLMAVHRLKWSALNWEVVPWRWKEFPWLRVKCLVEIILPKFHWGDPLPPIIKRHGWTLWSVLDCTLLVSWRTKVLKCPMLLSRSTKVVLKVVRFNFPGKVTIGFSRLNVSQFWQVTHYLLGR